MAFPAGEDEPDAPTVCGPWTGRHTPTVGHRADEYPWVEGRRRVGRARRALLLAVGGCLPQIVVTVLLCAVGALFVRVDEPGRAIGLVTAALALLVAGMFPLAWWDLRTVRYTLTEDVLRDDIVTEVRFADLVAVRVRRLPTGGPAVRLRDTTGAALTVPLGLIEGHPLIWHTVWRGIASSAAQGARLDERTRRLLHIPE